MVQLNVSVMMALLVLTAEVVSILMNVTTNLAALVLSVSIMQVVIHVNVAVECRAILTKKVVLKIENLFSVMTKIHVHLVKNAYRARVAMFVFVLKAIQEIKLLNNVEMSMNVPKTQNLLAV